MKRLSCAVLLSLLAVMACRPDASYLSYQAAQSDDSQSSRVIDSCSLTGTSATIAILEFDAAPRWVEKECPDPKWSSHAEHEVSVVETLVGQLPSKLTIASELLGEVLVTTTPGDQILASLRNVDGLWIVVKHVGVTYETDRAVAVSNTSENGVDLPPSLDALRAELQEAALMEDCGSRFYHLTLDDAAFAEELKNREFCDPPTPEVGGDELPMKTTD